MAICTPRLLRSTIMPIITLENIFDRIITIENLLKAKPDEGEYLDEKQASARYGLSVSWFRLRRLKGDGPPFIKIGSRVAYSSSDLQRFFSSHIAHSTSNYKAKD
jgi:predicted DNA-binding transcriptional regulator AlpA